MTTRGVASVADLVCTSGQAASSPVFTTKGTADAAKLAMNAVGATINAAFIQVSNNIDENNPDTAAAATAATWLTLQRGAPLADVVTPASATVEVEYDPFVCRAWRIKGGTSAAPANFANTFTIRVMKQFEL